MVSGNLITHGAEAYSYKIIWMVTGIMDKLGLQNITYFARIGGLPDCVWLLHPENFVWVVASNTTLPTGCSSKCSRFRMA
jgi:hypothetical protein